MNDMLSDEYIGSSFIHKNQRSFKSDLLKEVPMIQKSESIDVMDYSPRKWAELNTTTEQMEEAAKLAFEMEEINASSITEDKLKTITGKRELSTVTMLEMIVDSRKNSSLEMLGSLLPSLERLYLDGSSLSSLRDLGTDLRMLQTLSLNGAGLTELDGISALPCLRELLLKSNKVSDLTPLCTHDALQIVDLSDNKIFEIDALEILGTCSKLYSLDLRGNPLEKALNSFSEHNDSAKGYREVVMYHITTLKLLDGNHLQFSLVDASFIAEAVTYLSDYLSKHDFEDEHVIEEIDVSPAPPWQSPLGHRSTSNSEIENVANSDTSSSLTQTGLSFAGAPSALLRNRRGGAKNNPALFSSAPLESINSSEVLRNVEEERNLDLMSSQDLDKKSSRKHRRPRKKDNLSSNSLDISLAQQKRSISNQSPSPTETQTNIEDEDMGGPGLMEAWRASRPCSSDDALPRVRNLSLSTSWELASPTSAMSPNTNHRMRSSEEGFVKPPAVSLSFEADSLPTRPHSAHTSTPSTVPAFLMFQPTSPSHTSDSDDMEPSCDDIDISFKSAQEQFNGQRRTRRHRGRGWQNPLEFNDKIFVAPDMSASSWGLDKTKGVLVPRYSKETIEEEEDDSSDSEEQVTRASLKARAQSIVVDKPNSASKACRKSRHDFDNEATTEVDTQVQSSPSKMRSFDEDPRPGSSSAAGRLGFDLESSLQAIEKWTDVSEMSTRKQRQLQEAAQNKQREAILLSSKPNILAPKATLCADSSNDVVRKSAVFRECREEVGEGVSLPDDVLVDMLKQPPKHVPQLRTRDAFRSFFKGCEASRMRCLLEAACTDQKKVDKRYNLVKDVLKT